MPVNQRLNDKLHASLPIGSDEEILGVYSHHWFVYASIWFIGIFAIIAIMAAALLIAPPQPELGETSPYRSLVIAAAAFFSFIVGIGTAIPAWLKSQEQLVVTDEAVLQVLQPSIFGSKVSQLSLQHVADVSVRKDFFGTILGFGAVTIETPGEQANYTFAAVPDPGKAAKVLIEAHENFIAALESGRLPTSIQKSGSAGHDVTVSAAEYQKFLDFQQYQARAAQEQTPSQPNPEQDQARDQ